MTTHRIARTALGTLLALLTLPSGPAPAVEAYDPLRQITQQVAKANLLIVQDRTGSMAWLPTVGSEPTAGGAGTGNLYWGSNSSDGYAALLRGNDFPALQRTWTALSGGSWASDSDYVVPSEIYLNSSGNLRTRAIPPGGTGRNGLADTKANVCSTSSCRYWVYVLTFEYPSRMSMVKNVFGETVNVISDYDAPVDPTVSLGGNAFAANWAPSGTKTVTVARWDRTADPYSRSPLPFWVYTLDYGAGMTGTNPGAPFAPINANKPKLDAAGKCTVGTCELSTAKSLLEKYADQVNWGLIYYNTSVSSTSASVAIDTTGGNPNLQKLKDLYRAVGDTGPSGTAPLSPDGSTGTLGALTTAKTRITTAIGTDTKLRGEFRCDRPYGVILVTDGLSNSGNPGGDNWISPCGTGPTSCDSQCSWPACYDCPNNWTNFAADEANELFLNTNTTSTAGAGAINVPVRTWSIGVSANVGPCELDYIAYMGRTDASSPNGRAGFGDWDAVKNPYIRKTDPAAPAEPNNPTLAGSTYDGPTGQYKYFRNTSQTYDPESTGHGHNAYFATTAEALAEALSEILNATAAGDYTTSAPVSGLSVGAGSQVYLASTEFPEWKGRLQAFDTSKTDPVIPGYLRLWEAGGVLNARTTDRAIYTWDPTNGNALVRIDISDPTLFGPSGKLSQISGVNISQAVGDFILGNDGTVSGTKREWLLGPIINSTPAIVGAPSPYVQTQAYPHSAFEGTYASRKALLWVGSDDGMLHAFRIHPVLDAGGNVLNPGGEEILALVPPTLLAKQVDLYANHVKYLGTAKGITGQPPAFNDHIYGVANAVRFGDVYSSSWGGYKTVAFIAMGPGFVQQEDGSMGPGQNQLIAIDITHPTPGDPNYNSSNPVQVLWTKSLGDAGWSQVAVPWSVPSLAPVDGKIAPPAPGATNWRLLIGTGYDNNNTGGANSSGTGTGTQNVGTVAGPPAKTFNRPEILVLDPVDGSVEATISSMTSPTSPVPYVGNQAFADTVFLDKSAKAYQNDNLADLGLQADLYGRVWFVGTSSGISFDSAKIGIDAQAKAGQPQPIYYPPAAGGVGDPTQGTATTPGCTVFAFGSGTLYEKSRYITGPNVGKSGSTGGLANFYPSLYVGAAPKPYPATLDSAKPLSSTNAVATATALFRATLGSLLRPRPPAGTPASELPYYSSADPNVPQETLSPSTQLTAPPYLLVPKSATGVSTALFLVYDPDIGCNGYSYVVQVDVQPKTTCAIDQSPWNASTNPNSTTKIDVYGAGVGAASGFTIAGTEVVVAKSGIGEGESAGLVKPPVPASITGGAGAVKPSWWRELK